jgi:4-alpha-glucanotransferase
MSFPRATGILLHPTSLPARGGIGDFGPAAYEFVDFLAAGKQSLWQVLPLGPLGFGNSPYSSTSAFAGNPLLISLERLAERGWIDRALIADLPSDVDPAEYASVFRRKMPLLAEAASTFARNMSGNGRTRYERFCQQNSEWLDDFGESAEGVGQRPHDASRAAVCLRRAVAGAATLLRSKGRASGRRPCHLRELR